MSDPTGEQSRPEGSASDELAKMRVDYDRGGFDEADLAPTWWEQFDAWLRDAIEADVTEPNAIVLGTASRDGDVATRNVLAKGVDSRGLVFYTNYASAKSMHLLENARASATFSWLPIHRQVHFRGPVEQVSPETTLAYWRQRPRGSQLGAWASTERPQSSLLSSRAELSGVLASLEQRFRGAEEVPLPPQWGGWLLRPETVEFWQGQRSRVHDRLRFRSVGDGWTVERLAP
ncbi:MAG: pyridoxamine 5'-phosphate oxidase [Nakamurella sp.]